MTQLFNVREQVQIYAAEAELLQQHKTAITNSYTLNEELSISFAIQLLCFYSIEDKLDINNLTSTDILTDYKNILRLLKSTFRSEKTGKNLKCGKLWITDLSELIELINQVLASAILSLQDWDKFLNKFSEYKIHARYIRKLAQNQGYDLSRIPVIRTSTSHDNAKEARALILECIKFDNPEQLVKLYYAPIGVSGLKSYIKTKINRQDYINLFNSNSKTFTNRWNEVLPEVKKILGISS